MFEVFMYHHFRATIWYALSQGYETYEITLINMLTCYLARFTTNKQGLKLCQEKSFFLTH